MTQLEVAVVDLIRKIRRDYTRMPADIMDVVVTVDRLLHEQDECAVCHEPVEPT